MRAPALTVSLVAGYEKLAQRDRAAIQGVVVHRIEVSQEDPTYADTPQDVARFFREHPIGQQATGGAMPYPVLIDGAGRVTQTVPLGRVTPHARAHNEHTVGVGCIGDFRGREPSAAQRAALVAVCAGLLTSFHLAIDSLKGHDELLGGSSDPNKICPGSGLALVSLRADVASALAQPVGELPLVF